MGEWKEIRLGDLITLHYGKSLPLRMRKDGDVPVYSSAGLIGRHDKALENSKGLIIGRKGTIGRVYKSERPFFAIDTSYYVLPKENKYSFTYLYYLLGSIGLEELNEDSAVPGLNRETAYSQLINLPPLSEQKAIAEVLSSLDNKIGLLHRKNQTLEKMAETLFRQWFVEEAHKDWVEKPLSSVATFLNGLACQKYPPQNDVDKLPVLKIKQLRTGITDDSDWCTADVKKQYIVENGDVIFSWSASLMVKIWNGASCVLNQHLFKVTSSEFPKWFYYLWCKHHLEEFIGISSSHATTMGHIKRQDLDNAMVLVPSKGEMEQFSEVLTPLIETIITNNNQLVDLKNLRNNLLPKLMCGEVRVVHE